MSRSARTSCGAIASLFCALALTGCGHAISTAQTEVYAACGEPCTWAAHTAVMGASVGATEIVWDAPWAGYALGAGLQIGWELSEANERRKRGIPRARAWTTALDLAIPLTAGALLAWLLDRGDG